MGEIANAIAAHLGVGPAARFASPAVPSRAPKSPGSDPSSPAGPATRRHRADRVSVFGYRPHGSWLDDPPDTRSLTPPAIPKTTASRRWLRYPPPPDLPATHKTLVPYFLRGKAPSR